MSIFDPPEAPPEPTPQQCSDNASIDSAHGVAAYACWYPQMGGYVGKAVIAVFPAEDPNDEGCCEAWVWHDGEFPFEGGNPKHLHHCDADQFVEFGQTWKRLSQEARALLGDD